MSLKNHRVEIRISEEEKKLIEKIKLETKKNTADLFREFLNSYDIENHNKNLKILLEELEEEKEKIYSELHLVYHNLRSHYLPYRGPVRKMRIYNVKHCFLLYLLNSSYFYTIQN